MEKYKKQGRRTAVSYNAFCIHFRAPYKKKDTEVLECVQKRVTKLIKAPKHKTCEERLREMRCSTWRGGDSGRIFLLSVTTWKEVAETWGSVSVISNRTRGNGLELNQGGLGY